MAPTPEVEFPVRPVTQIQTTPEGTSARIGQSLTTYTDPEDWGSVLIAVLATGQEYRYTFFAEVTVNLPGQIEGVTVHDGVDVLFRETTSHDVIAARISTYPWPLPVIRAYVNDKVMNVHLEALADDNGNVMTIMQVSDAGIWLRYSGAWVELMNPDTIEDWGAIEVDDSALPMYDAFDQSGQTTTVFALPVKDPLDLAPYRGDAVTAIAQTGVSGGATQPDAELLEPESSPPEPAPHLPMPVIETARDIPHAIEVAAADPEHRWYVERRLKAMGLDADLPWKQS